MSRNSGARAILAALLLAAGAVSGLPSIGCKKAETGTAAMTSSPPPPSQTPESKAASGDRKVLYWYDPMVPGSKFDKPGKSPFMDMQLVPKYADEGGGATASAAAITLSPEAIRAVGIAVVPASRRPLARTVRAVGTVEADETGQARVSARVAGRIEKLYADFTGQSVRAGSPLYSLYSPDLVATQREYLLALENRRRLSHATPEAAGAADDLVSASRDRLRLWGIAPAQIAALEASGKPELSLVYSSPITGTVMQKMVVVGQYVTEGTELYALADLSRVWLEVRVYEYELSALRVGQPAETTFSALPGRTLPGRIAFIDPVVDRDTRSARVRIELANPRGELKPGMFGDARLEIPETPALVIPRSALIDTGQRRIVYVETAPNTFSPRAVETGASSGDQVAIVGGLSEGERVVAAANFFIDSQAQLSGGASIQWSGALDVKTTPTEEKP